MAQPLTTPAYENVAHILDQDLATLPNPLFTLVNNTGQITTHTMEELREGAYRWAATMAGTVGQGDRVVLCMPTSVDFLQAFFAVQLVGAVAVPMPYAFHRQAEYLEEYLRTRASVVDDCRAVAMATHPDLADVSEQLAARCESMRAVYTSDNLVATSEGFEPTLVGPDGLALLQYTSGSTGTPKGVEITHRCLVWNLDGIREGMQGVEGDRVVSWLPLYHDMGLIGGWLWPLAHGCQHALMATEVFLANPYFWLQAMTQIKATITVAPNFGYALCVKRIKDQMLATLDLSTLRVGLCGAEPIDARAIAAFHDRFAAAGLPANVVMPVYGLAEATLAVTFTKPGDPVKTKVLDRTLLEGEGKAVEVDPGLAGAMTVVGVGTSLLDSTVRILDAADAEVEPGIQGEIVVRSGSVMKGYYKRSEASQEALRDGWLHTGDLGFLDEDGQLYVTGRIKDLIITYGRNFYPHDIEWLAAETDGVRTGCVAAFGVPNDEASTEEIIVVAETKQSDREALIAMRRDVRKLLLSTIECNPKQIILVAPGKVPKTTSGKIRRVEARRQYLTGELDKLL